MQALSDTALLAIWERGRTGDAVARALLLLDAALPQLGLEDGAELTIGDRNAAILKLRRATFGDRLPGCVDCRQCGERLEFEFDPGELPAASIGARQFTLASGLRFRLPTSRDLAAAAESRDEDAAVEVLLRRCCLDAPAVAWSADLLPAVEAEMAWLQQAADIEIGLVCAACGHGWSEPFDICGYFWDELEQRAARLLDDVHRLALVYGWDEQRILALSDVRRDAYLARCDQ